MGNYFLELSRCPLLIRLVYNFFDVIFFPLLLKDNGTIKDLLPVNRAGPSSTLVETAPYSIALFLQVCSQYFNRRGFTASYKSVKTLVAGGM